jgi:2-polyprenyl-3-methyl-5-hydroxy-6-metoxy-1,4-benzoquinol methylase
LEKFLANARLALLQFAADGQVFDEDIGKNPDENILDFFSALAQQCFINEYVYYSDDVESELAQHIRNEVEQNLMQGLPVSPLTLLAVASYFPLYKISAAQQLLDHAWPGTINNLLIQQLIQPLEEEKYQLGITRLTTIQDQTSLAVQHQYEENPYPRWVKYAAQSAQMSIDDYLNKEFPHVYLAPIAKTAELDILIAGCGTGMQAIDVARNFIGAKVLAVDLSLQSLSYAARKSHEFGITNIDYAQADILQIGNIGRIFDVIESVGVLHHMQDPLAGLQQLLKVLKPDGVMKLGFYSELARSEVVKARELIAQKGYGANAADIRRLRYEVWTAGKFPGLTSSRDFFSISECRDLLFHIQEQRFSIPAIKHMLEDRGLLFLGFQLAPSILKRYAERFPEDQAKTNLDNWHIFETENPATFISMYQFWVQNKRPASPGT